MASEKCEKLRLQLLVSLFPHRRDLILQSVFKWIATQSICSTERLLLCSLLIDTNLNSIMRSNTINDTRLTLSSFVCDFIESHSIVTSHFLMQKQNIDLTVSLCVKNLNCLSSCCFSSNYNDEEKSRLFAILQIWTAWRTLCYLLGPVKVVNENLYRSHTCDWTIAGNAINEIPCSCSQSSRLLKGGKRKEIDFLCCPSVSAPSIQVDSFLDNFRKNRQYWINSVLSHHNFSNIELHEKTYINEILSESKCDVRYWNLSRLLMRGSGFPDCREDKCSIVDFENENILALKHKLHCGTHSEKGTNDIHDGNEVESISDGLWQNIVGIFDPENDEKCTCDSDFAEVTLKDILLDITAFQVVVACHLDTFRCQDNLFSVFGVCFLLSRINCTSLNGDVLHCKIISRQLAFLKLMNIDIMRAYDVASILRHKNVLF